MNKKLIFPLTGSVLSLLGIVNASYISYEIFSGSFPTCTPPFQCRTVLESVWINPLGIPLPTVGILYFLILLILSIYHFVTLSDDNWQRSKQISGWLWKWSLLGAGFATYTLGVMTFAIKGFCLYCLISDGMLGINFGLNLWHRQANKQLTTSEE